MAKLKMKVPSLLTELTGKPTAHTCKKKVKCFRCKDTIELDSTFFQIPKQRSGVSSKKAHCLRCFSLIFTQTKKEISVIEAHLQTAIDQGQSNL